MINVAITITHQVVFIQILVIHDNISSQVVDTRKIKFWPNSRTHHHP